jgi:amino acid adenylation domain-containing protein
MMRLDQFVSAWAEYDPNHIAVEGLIEKISYRDLDQLANRFARLFMRLGVRKGDRVGVHMPRSARTVAAMLGALRVGGVYVPLDPGSPPARIALIAKDCGIRCVVISPVLLSSWLASSVESPVRHFVLSADGPLPATGHSTGIHHWSEVLSQSAERLELPGDSYDDLAYMLYTSGSTGVPKGVMLSHRNAFAFIEWAANQIELNHSDRVASVAPFHFDLSIFDVWSSLWVGATMVIVDETTVVSGPRMLERIRQREISVWYSVPSALILMLDQADLESKGAPSLRAVYFAGEVFPMKHLRRAMHALPRAQFWNLFGPTETNVCLAHELPAVPAEDETAIPIGLPTCGNKVYVVNEAGQLVQPGQVGELLVDGPTVMVGYWNAGSPILAERPYRTGDMVSQRPDGALMYHGRRDHMVKVHGHRIELGEVESALLLHPGIQEAIAIAVDQGLVAVLVASDAQLSVLQIKQHCASQLPRYMIPSDVRLVSSMPRTTSGKIDRVKLKSEVLAGNQARIEALAAESAPVVAQVAARGTK